MANAVWKGHIAFGMVSFPYADSADSLLNNGAAGSMAPEGRDVGAHLEHLGRHLTARICDENNGLNP